MSDDDDYAEFADDVEEYSYDPDLKAYTDDFFNLYLKNGNNYIRVGTISKINKKTTGVDKEALQFLINKINVPAKLEARRKLALESFHSLLKEYEESNSKDTIVVKKHKQPEIVAMLDSINDEIHKRLKPSYIDLFVKKESTQDVRSQLKKLVSRRMKLRRTINNLVPGCNNIETPFIFERVSTVASEGNLIRLKDKKCYDITELVNYIISKNGINKGEKGKPIWDDSRNELNKILTFKDKNGDIHPDAARLRRFYSNTSNLITEIKNTFTEKDIQGLEKTGQILSARGPFFEKEISKLPVNLRNEWNEKRASMTLLEPPSDLSVELGDTINNIKAISLSKLNSRNLSEAKISLLDRLSIATGSSTTYSRDIAMCIKGEDCMMRVGNKILQLVNLIKNGTQTGGRSSRKFQKYTKAQLINKLKPLRIKGLRTKSKDELIKILKKN